MLVEAEELTRELARLIGERLIPKRSDEPALGGRRPKAQLESRRRQRSSSRGHSRRRQANAVARGALPANSVEARLQAPNLAVLEDQRLQIGGAVSRVDRL